jgi:hypothetical protein
MILPFLLAAVTAAAPAPVPAGPALPAARTIPEPAISPKTEMACGYLKPKIVKKAEPAHGKEPAKPGEAVPEYEVLAGFHVMDGPFQLAAPKVDSSVIAYRCTRDTIVPAQYDGRVLIFLRKPLILTDGARVGILQMQKGGFMYNVTKGTVSDAEKESIQRRVDLFTANYRQAAAAASKAPPAAPVSEAEAPVKTKR